MKRGLVFLILALLMLPALSAADTVSEVKQEINDSFAYSRENNVSPSDEISADGSVEFWSSGGLLNWADPGATPQQWESFNLHPKHIKVIPLVEGEIALAFYYSEGSMQPKGFPAVSHYLTRVSEVYVKEGGTWKRRSAHWSRVGGGSGTTQSAE